MKEWFIKRDCPESAIVVLIVLMIVIIAVLIIHANNMHSA